MFVKEQKYKKWNSKKSHNIVRNEKALELLSYSLLIEIVLYSDKIVKIYKLWVLPQGLLTTFQILATTNPNPRKRRVVSCVQELPLQWCVFVTEWTPMFLYLVAVRCPSPEQRNCDKGGKAERARRKKRQSSQLSCCPTAGERTDVGNTCSCWGNTCQWMCTVHVGIWGMHTALLSGVIVNPTYCILWHKIF